MKNLFDHADTFAAADSDLNALAAPDLPVTDLELAPVDPGAPTVDQGAITPFAVTIITGTPGNDVLVGDANGQVNDDHIFGFGA